MIKLSIRPDLQTRESVMAAAGRVQLAVTDEDGTRYVKIEAKAKQSQGSAKRYLSCSLDEATHVFVSEKGYGTTSLGTYYPAKGMFYENIALDDPHMSALNLIVGLVNGTLTHHTLNVDDRVQITAESQCGMCGRRLEDPVSVRRGIGPECAAKPTGTKILHASAFRPAVGSGGDAVIEEAERVTAILSEHPDAVILDGRRVDLVDDNAADAALVATGVDVQGLSDGALRVLAAAVSEETSIRASRQLARA